MKLLLSVITALVLIGCAGKAPPDLQLYLLRSDSANQFNAADTATIGLGSLRVASYIDQPGLVLETADGSMHPARYNQWAEPLRESLRLVIAADIASAIGQPVRPRVYGEINWKLHTDRMIDITIERMHGTQQGDALLVAYWAVIDPGARSIISEHQFSRSQPLASSGYPALVAAHKELLNSLAGAISESLE